MNILLGLFPLFNRIKYLYFYYTFVGVCYINNNNNNNNNNNDFPLEEIPFSPTGQFKQSLDSFYVTDSHLSVTNISQMAMFYLN